ncbi:MAG: hypothetical protein ACLSXM_11095, partial [Turicibacter sanguinis]
FYSSFGGVIRRTFNSEQKLTDISTSPFEVLGGWNFMEELFFETRLNKKAGPHTFLFLLWWGNKKNV